ncbi:hypothetical protein GXM_04899 [Nostoc sphaeroides CCNUC1]|uniref:Uncharacterized protein n=1 Tax=Nostoc sphaeroides CCNUC1 TaxID=2653204 RepID=A0A5P8W3T0_9NOSO|nr:hypothetical protein GXM_04899 [Nostoc sphaeroides CCNUC1]
MIARFPFSLPETYSKGCQIAQVALFIIFLQELKSVHRP